MDYSQPIISITASRFSCRSYRAELIPEEQRLRNGEAAEDPLRRRERTGDATVWESHPPLFAGSFSLRSASATTCTHSSKESASRLFPGLRHELSGGQDGPGRSPALPSPEPEICSPLAFRGPFLGS